MHPNLLQIGPYTLHSYTVLVDLGIIAGVLIAYWEAKRVKFDTQLFADLAIWVVLGGFIGARLYHVVLFWNDYSRDWLGILRIWDTGGLVFQGAFLGGLAAGFVFLWRNKLPFWQAADFTALGLVFGHALGRVGCFFAGCCYGSVCTLPWGVHFPALPDGLYHPTQLYEAAANLGIFAILLLVRKRKPFDGFVFLSYAMLYSAVRFGNEFLRGDPTDMVGFLRLAQGVTIATFVAAALLFLVLKSRRTLLPKTTALS